MLNLDDYIVWNLTPNTSRARVIIGSQHKRDMAILVDSKDLIGLSLKFGEYITIHLIL